jgi:hypothetical protein
MHYVAHFPRFPLKTYKSPAWGSRPSFLLDLQRQAVHAAPHVGLADRQPHPHPRRNRDHRRDSTLTTAAAKPAGTEPGIRTRTLPANSSSIVGSAVATCAAGISAGAINTCAKPSATAQFLSPTIELASADVGAARYIADHRTRHQTLRDDRPLLVLGPAPPPFRPVITSTRAIAPSLALVQALSFAPMASRRPRPTP